MITNPALQWLLSAAFILLTAYSLLRVLRSRAVHDRIGYGAHALMGLAMAAMVWPWGMQLLLVPQMVIFSLAALWFLYLLVARGSQTRPDGHDAGHHSSRGQLAYHGAMMAAMVLMAAGMGAIGAGSTQMSGMAAMGSMPGMDMSAGAMSAGMAIPLWVSVLASICAAGFGVAVLYYLGSTLAGATSPRRQTRAGRHITAEATWNLLMAAGMAALFLPLISFS